MNNQISDERLRYHATRSWTAFDAGTYDELQAIAAELLAAREHMGVVQCGLDAAHLEQVEDELGGLRAEIRRLDGIIDDIEERAWETLGRPEGTYDSTNVQRLCAEVEQIKADRDSLLRIIGDSFMNLHIPHSAMAFDGRNLTPHAEESARASEIYRTERDAARADLREAMELLRAFRRDRHTIADWEPIWYQADALLAKHEKKQ